MKFHELFLDNLIDPVNLLKLTQHFSHDEGTCLLYSGTSYETVKSSYLFLFPFDIIKIHGAIKQRSQLGKETINTDINNPWDAIAALGPDIGKGENSFPEWVGFFSYEMGAFSDQDVILPYHKATTPEAYWQRSAITLALDYATGKSFVRLLDSKGGGGLHSSQVSWLEKLSTKEGWQTLLNSELAVKTKIQELRLDRISDSQEGYIQKIKKIKEYLSSGDIYQINLSQQWEFIGEYDPFDLFKRLSLLNPAPFSAYLYLKDYAVISSSPERFLQNKSGILETRPIKGTAPRGTNEIEDVQNRQGLLASEKERAELMMITDLMRNDLGIISCPGSVEVPLLCGCESYHNVFHLHSVVRSRALPSKSFLEIIRACFPAGSITGCPKLRAMELIGDLEQRPRGIYTGSIGYFSKNGDFDLNVAIRTIIATDQRVNVQLGGGIVYDSDPQNEYEETYHKGRSIFEILTRVN